MSARPFSVTRLPGFATVAVIVFVALYAPIVTLVVYSFNAAQSVSIWGGLSLKWYVAAWANDTVQEATLRSLHPCRHRLGGGDHGGDDGGARHHAARGSSRARPSST